MSKIYAFNNSLVQAGNNLLAGEPGGSSVEYTAGDYISIEDNEISVTGISAGDGTLSVVQNVTGAPLNIIYPTDVSPDVIFYQINSVSGNAYAPGPSQGVVNYYYGETSADFNGSGDSIQFTISDDISNINSIYFYYATDATGVGGPSLTTTSISGGSTGILQSGTYKLKAQYNQAGTSSPYGKYLQIMFNWRSYASADTAQSLQWAQEALSKITFFGVTRPDSSLGVTVNLDRYYLSNTETTSHATECVVETDTTNKKQKVFLPYNKPSLNSWKDVQFIAYGSGSVSSSVSNEYIAYKQLSGASNFTFAFLTDSNYTNRIYTFVTFEPINGKFEKWTYNGNTGVTNRWTTETINDVSALEAEIQAVSGALDDYIPYSASGVYLPNSKFEIDAEGQAYKIVTDASEIDYSRFDTGIYFRGDGSSSIGTYKATLPSNVHHIYIETNGGAIVTGTYDIATHSAIINVSSLPLNYSDCYVFAYDSNSNLIELSGSNTTVKYIVPPVTEEYITESAVTGIEAEIQAVSAAIQDTIPIQVVASSAAATGTDILYIVTGE